MTNKQLNVESIKVLWFTNTPANACDFLKVGPSGGGWLKSLDKILQKKVELHVAFYYPRSDKSFRYLETCYHPIIPNNWKANVLKGLITTHITDKEDINKYLEIIEKVKPDIIHINGTENPFACIIPVIEIPVVTSLQGCMTVYSYKFDSGYSKKNLLKSNKIGDFTIAEILRHKSFLKIKKEFKRMAIRERSNLLNTKYIIGRTSWDKRISRVLSPKSLYFHGDEILRDKFYERSWSPRQSNKLIVHTTSGNSPYKGFETICESLNLLNSISAFETEWRVAGIKSNDSIVRVTKDRLRSKFPRKGLVLLGEITEEHIFDCLAESTVYVSPSHIENSSNSLCEALLIGIPCIATYAGGTGSLMRDGEDGVLIQDGDPWAMAGAILEIFGNPEKAISLGRKARERALLRHDPERIVNELIEVYKMIISLSNSNLSINEPVFFS